MLRLSKADRADPQEIQHGHIGRAGKNALNLNDSKTRNWSPAK
jgi:hypothetical protein